MDPIVREALDAAAHGDWTVLRLKLHPYVRWETADGDTLRGRNRVMAMLHEEPSLRPPAAYELRDGQIYRWTSARRGLVWPRPR